MPHADTAADVTARALAAIEQARDIHAAIPPENPFEAITLHGMQIAAAAVRLVQAIDADELQEGWRDEIAICDDLTSAGWRGVLAAIRAAGEAQPS